MCLFTCVYSLQHTHMMCTKMPHIYQGGEGAFESSLHKFYKWSLSQGQGKAKMKNRKVKRRKLEIN